MTSETAYTLMNYLNTQEIIVGDIGNGLGLKNGRLQKV